MGNVGLSGIDSVSVEIVFHELTFLKTYQDGAKTSKKGKGGINFYISEGSTWTVDSLSDGYRKTLQIPLAVNINCIICLDNPKII